MKLDPGFLNHWKTELLIAELGAEGVVAVLRLWGNAQIRRQWSGLKLTPRRLAMETKWKGDENHLFSVLTDTDAPWLDPEDGGTWAIHAFDEHQRQVIALWENGAKGGRPRKVSPTPPSKEKNTHPLPLTLLGYETKPNGNHLVSGGREDVGNSSRYATHAEVAAYAKGQPMPISEDCIDAFFDRMEEIGWTDDKGLPLANWQARFRRYATNWTNNRNRQSK